MLLGSRRSTLYTWCSWECRCECAAHLFAHLHLSMLNLALGFRALDYRYCKSFRVLAWAVFDENGFRHATFTPSACLGVRTHRPRSQGGNQRREVVDGAFRGEPHTDDFVIAVDACVSFLACVWNSRGALAVGADKTVISTSSGSWIPKACDWGDVRKYLGTTQSQEQKERRKLSAWIWTTQPVITLLVRLLNGVLKQQHSAGVYNGSHDNRHTQLGFGTKSDLSSRNATYNGQTSII